jgi:hypothetical protein
MKFAIVQAIRENLRAQWLQMERKDFVLAILMEELGS